MAQLALGIAGAAIGSAFGGIGASIGWSIGAALGGLLDPPKQQGPRLPDLRLQRSSYGGMLPIVYGTIRTPGNVIWQTDLTEHEHKSGGKGGTETTNFTYSASWAIALCEGEIADVTRIWANGRLKFDTVQGSDFDNGDFTFTRYLGSEDQEPDPTMQAELGADQVPAYLGTAYVVFTDLDLTEFGNTIPNLEFEVVTKLGAIPVRVSTFDTIPSSNNGATMQAVVAGVNGAPTEDLDHNALPDNTVITAWYDAGANTYTERYTNYLTGASVGADITKTIGINGFCFQIQNSLWAAINIDAISSVWAYRGTPTVYAVVFWAPTGPGLRVGNYFFQMQGSSPLTVGRYTVGEEGVPTSTVPDLTVVLSAGSANSAHLDFAGNGNFCVNDNDTQTIFELDTDLNIVEQWDRSSLSGNDRRFYKYRDFFAFQFTSGIGSPRLDLYDVVGTGGSAVWSLRPNSVVPFTFLATPVIPLFEGRGLVIGRDGVARLDGNPEGTTVGETVANISTRCGFDEADFDVSDLPDPLPGYIVTQQASGRAMIEPLQQFASFDGAEIDDVIVFKHRGKPSIATIPDSELAAHLSGETKPAPLTVVRTMEQELPRRINVNYINNVADYQPGSQAAERQTTQSQDNRTINLAIAMGDAKAKAVANTQLFEAWLRRDKGSIYLPRKWAKLTPMDVITVKGRDWQVRKINETPRGVFKLDIEPSLGAVYVQTGVGAPSTGIGGTTLTTKALTDLLLLDIPLTADGDIPNGFYAATAARGGGTWPGTSLQKSIDDGASYAEIASSSIRNTIGETTDVLAEFNGGNVFDELDSVTVLLSSGSLSGTTAAAVLNGANTGLIGNEIVQFRDAELVAEDTYTLTGLLRGRRGTEWAMSNHQVGDVFVLLPVSDIDAPSADLMRTRLYKAVTFGKTLSSADEVAFANSGNRLKPYAPVQLGGGVDGGGNVTINWKRRTRIGGNWADFADVPLGETSEKYEVQIWDAGYSQCARIIETTSQTAAYSAGDQTTDFGALQETIYFTVGQVGAIGLGRNAQGSVPGGGVSNTAPLAPITPYNNPTVPPPTSGVCSPVGSVINTNQSWTTPGRVYSGAFTTDDVWVVQFTTGANVAGFGLFSAAEYGGGPIARTAEIALSPCGTALASTTGTTISFNLSGTAGTGLVQVSPNTTYYVTITTASDGQMFADLIPNR